MRFFRRVLPFVLPVLFAGCTLIDQTTFVPNPEPPGPGQIAATAAMDQRVPLLVIKYDLPDPPYRDLLRYAVLAADRRDPSIEFDVVAVVPGAPTAPAGPATEAARQNAVKVMTAMTALGVAGSRIHLGARNDAAVTAPEVRVYVR